MKKTIQTILVALIIPSMVLAIEFEYSFWGSTMEKKANEEAVAAFMNENPGVTVKIRHIPKGYREKIMTALARGSGPDVGYVSGDPITYYEDGLIEDLDVIYKTDEEVRERMEYIIHRKGGKVIATSMCLVHYVLFYNKDLLDKANVSYPPSKWRDAWTWDEYVDVAKTLTLDGNGNNAHSPNFDPNDVQQYGTMEYTNAPPRGPVMAYLYSNGGQQVNDEGTKLVLDSQESIEVFQNMQDLIYKHHAAPKPGVALTVNKMGRGGGLQRGNIAMMVHGTYNVLDLNSREGLKWGMGVMPYYKRPTTVGGCGTMAIYKGAKHHDTLIKFIKFMATPENNVLFKNGLWLPNRWTDYLNPKNISKWIDAIPATYGSEARDVLVDYTILSMGMNARKNPQMTVEGYDIMWRKCMNPMIDDIFSGKRRAAEVLRDVVGKCSSMLKGLR